MKLLSNTLKPHYDKWTDPGDYPSGAGSAPLPDGEPYIDAFDGTIKVELEPKDVAKLLGHEDNTISEAMEILIPVSITECVVRKWGYKHCGGWTFEFWPVEWD